MFDNDINGICIPQINETKRLLCIYNLAIKGFGNLMILFYCDFVKLPPYPTKILKIAMSLRDMQIHVGKLGHISTDSWELFSVLWPATTASTIHSTIHCIIYNKALCNSTYLTLQYKIIANLDYRWLFPHPAKHMDHPESTFIFPKNPVH